MYILGDVIPLIILLTLPLRHIQNLATIDYSTLTLIPVTELQSNYFDLEAADQLPQWTGTEPQRLRSVGGS